MGSKSSYLQPLGTHGTVHWSQLKLLGSWHSAPFPKYAEVLATNLSRKLELYRILKRKGKEGG